MGAQSLLPIIPGVIPFGLIMGTVAHNSGLNLFESMSLNVFVFAGASQLAALELMAKDTPAFIVILTGLVINLRFMMYSAALSPIFQNKSHFKKALMAYSLTDQSYAVSNSAFPKLNNNIQKFYFYAGAAVVMAIAWHLSTLAGVLFGNFAPQSLSLDFAIPLAFMALIVPSLKDYKMITVASAAGFCSLIFYNLPYNLGLITSAFIALFVAWLIEKKEAHHE